MRALVIGHFSTMGDIEVLREVERQLDARSMQWDVAPLAKGMVPFDPRWIDVRAVKPADYTHLLVVCGPFWRPYYLRCRVDLDAFAHCTRIGVNLSMIEDINSYNPFDRLIGRDNDNWTRPDIAFLHQPAKAPVAGLCLVRSQSEYGKRQKHDGAGAALRRLARRNGLAVIELDTEWPAQRNSSGLGSPEEFESVCARMDVVLTTRLHGTVLSLKNGVPVIAIDAISGGGGKVLRQAKVIGWPEAFSIDQATDTALDEALARCLKPAARDLARSCTARARQTLGDFSEMFEAAIHASAEGKPSYTSPAERPSRFGRKLQKIRRKLTKYFPKLTAS